MKLTVITSSHHRHGTSALLADEFIRGACEAGHSVFRFDAAFEHVSPCLACDRCRRIANYDFVINPAHFKGHMMGGFGEVIKNMSIGIASSRGKGLIHSAGKETSDIFNTPQDDFLESMAEAAKGMADYLGENILYINVMNNLSVDCDCDSHPTAPTMQDIGIMASLDPVALDQASVDQVYAAPDGKDLIERMESRHGIHTLEHAEALGLGSRKCELINIDEAVKINE